MNPQTDAQNARLSFIIFPVKTLTVLLFTLAMCVHAADKVTVKINGKNISAYRTADLENAKKDAKAANKPIAWIASDPQCLNGQGIIAEESSDGATWHAFFSLRDKAILVFQDAYGENHKVLRFIDQALHTPNPHYTPPTVLFLNSDATEVIATVTYERNFVKRAQKLSKALEDIKGKF